jgi:hypothetical protein
VGGKLTVDDESFDADVLERKMKGLARRASIMDDAAGWGHGERAERGIVIDLDCPGWKHAFGGKYRIEG